MYEFNLGKRAAETACQLFAIMLIGSTATAAETTTLLPKETIAIDTVPSCFPVGFSLATDWKRGHQYVAYYKADHQMVLRHRRLGEKEWTVKKLDQHIPWDSHNSITMCVDADGILHLSGNQHCVPLVYYRTDKVGDIMTLKRLPMTGQREHRVTYPCFIEQADAGLLFTYRDGGSGNGSQIMNIYDRKTRMWRRNIDTVLFDGEGNNNAYAGGYTRPGPDGYYHLYWVWRVTPDCRTNHDPSYARSRNLIDWETITGRPIKLPITVKTPGVLIDQVPVDGGIINGGLRIGFDSQNRPVASYHKFDKDGKTQVYAARFADGKWVIRQISDWDYRWYFHGGGAIPNKDIGIGGATVVQPGVLGVSFRHIKEGRGMLLFDEETFAPLGTKPAKATSDAQVGATVPREDHPDREFLSQRRANDRYGAGPSGEYYQLVWETRGRNRDRQPEGAPFKPSTLKLIYVEPPAAGK